MGTNLMGKGRGVGRAHQSRYFLLVSFGDERIGDSFLLPFPLSSFLFPLSGGRWGKETGKP